MAIRGVKQKPVALKLVDGTRNTTRHGSEEDLRAAVDAADAAFGKLTKPRGLSKHSLDAWKRWIVPAGWLDKSREAAAIAFCHLWAEFIAMPDRFPASKHGQLRAYMSELGLTDERNRGAANDGPRDEFFDG